MSDLERQVIEPMRRVSGSIRFEFTPPRMQLASVAVKPGNRANPKGRPKLDPAIKAAKLEAKSVIVDVKAAAKENTADAIKTVMNNDHAPSAARVGAAIAILDRGWGKPTQAVRSECEYLRSDDGRRTEDAARCS